MAGVMSVQQKEKGSAIERLMQGLQMANSISTLAKPMSDPASSSNSNDNDAPTTDVNTLTGATGQNPKEGNAVTRAISNRGYKKRDLGEY